MDTESDADQQAFIRLRRAEATWRDYDLKYRVLIDGKKAGSIGWGKTKAFPVSPGRHTLKLKVGMRSSPEKVVDLEGGDIAEFICSPGWSGLEGGSRFIDRFYQPHSDHIALEGPTPGSTPGLL
jgi:hypothetical protein